MEPTVSLQLRGFSNPGEVFSGDLFATLTAGWTREAIHVAATRVTARSLPVFEYLRQGAPLLTARTAMNPAFSAITGVLTSSAPAPASWIAAACAMAEAGVPGGCSLLASGSARMRFGRWLLPLSRKYGLECTGRDVSIEAGATRLRFERSNAGWRAESDGTDLLAVYPGNIAAYCRNYRGAWDLFPVEASVRRGMLSPADAPVAEALELVRTRTPAYYDWIVRVTSVLVLSPAGGSSRSYPSRLGLIRIAAGGDAVDIASQLAAEASRQYVYLTARLGGLLAEHDPAQLKPGRLRLSPLVRQLLDFHAAANQERMLTAVTQSGYASGTLDAALREAASRARSLEKELAAEQFSPLGRALFLPLGRG